MSEQGGPAAAGPPSLVVLGEALARAETENAEGRPTRARRRLRPLLHELSGLTRSPDVARLRGRALVELAKADFETRGAPGPALDELDAMLVEHERDPVRGWPGLVPAVAGLRGLLALRAGRQHEALHWLDEAVASIDDADPIDACRVLLNRGVLHTDMHHVALSRADYAECARRARRAGFELLTFKAEHNLGYLDFVAGNLPEALARMEAAARILPGPPRPTALLDRARVLLEAGLVGVADQTLEQAAALFEQHRRVRDVAECELGRAECALLRGDVVAARGFAASAARRFRRRREDAWVVRADLLALQVDAVAFAQAPADDPRTRALWAGLARRAARLEATCRATGRTGWEVGAAYVRIEADLARGALDAPGVLLDELGTVRGSDPIAVRLHGRWLRAKLALAAGERSRAVRFVHAGQRDLALHRSRFGSLDLRTAGAVHGRALASLDIELALATGRPAAVLDAAERVRAVIGGTPRVNPPSDPESAALLSQLRRLIDDSRGVIGRASADPVRSRAFREAQRLKHEILARSWHERGQAGDERPGRAADVRRVLAARPGSVLVDIGVHGGRLLAVTFSARGAVLHELGEASDVAELVRRVHADLEVTANPLVPAELRDVAHRSLAHGTASLESRLAPVLDAPDELVVVATGWLGALPWSMLGPRRGRATVVAPSVHHWARYAGTAPEVPEQVTAVAGPGLRHADDEAREVGAAWPQGRSVVGADATVARMIELLGSPGIVHLAAHGRHEPDNPLFSSVRLADGPLFAHELDAGGRTPDLVVLSSCEVGRASVRAGGEALGMASVLLRRGVGCVVAAIAPLPDETAMRVMTHVHALLRDGVPVARAVAAAVERDAQRTGEVAPLMCFGAPV
ncbi:CHAT domain-containing protein [Cellulomonas fimi]|uniref:Tetratricopeptide TPR_4 n=1 Tax=Cellulomonas fimi (strain ATCC 484 / DSM 20113 / JCM 1341 / CCUG 24087 / LMG 16345 / NBRC 15513 / NCIMB 8980 / NCTC 7547 / NRS-133) TaxID=590998 RepID=F4H1V7_CELFA|nr:CHAT domain-containing protein [Cellulomonas fimi]AEE45127.1 tetratricopeptide TPR_4 [Cellulomonas fimi ATCC 484]NNH06310.1 CHAT domain-containing protein [Cellulomonas fimi]VEH28321.1 ATP-dependent transcriptional regulator [Cellulomonas fimi]